MSSRKRSISIRMNEIDIDSVKKLARRLGVRDSGVVRCAVKMMMAKLGLLVDASVRGRGLIPVFVESGSDLFRHFDLDPVRLEAIINDGADDAALVSREDVQLIAMNGMRCSYVKLRLSAIGNGNGDAPHFDHSERESSGDTHQDESLRRYLYAKYVYRSNSLTIAESGVVSASAVGGTP